LWPEDGSPGGTRKDSLLGKLDLPREASGEHYGAEPADTRRNDNMVKRI